MASDEDVSVDKKASSYGLVAMAGDAVQVTKRWGAGTCSVPHTIQETWRAAYDLSGDSVAHLAEKSLEATVALARQVVAGLPDLHMANATLGDLGKEAVGADQRGNEIVRT